MFRSSTSRAAGVLRSARPLLTQPPPPIVNGTRLVPYRARIPLASILVGAAVVGGAAYFGQDAIKSSSGPKLPQLPTPVPALTLEEATEKLRSEEHMAYFDAGSGRTGQVYRVRLQSNAPTEDDWVSTEANGEGNKPQSFWGVFDGHAGWATSTVLRQSLVPYVSAHLSPLPSDTPSSTLISSIKAAFLALDKRIFTDAEATLSSPKGSIAAISALAPAIAGSCALLSMYNPSTSTLYTACVGDSRAVLGRLSATSTSTPSASPAPYQTLPLSTDQTGKLASERERILAAHPNEPDCVDARSGRVLGLAVTRAFGDSRWKWDTTTQTRAQNNFFAQAPRPKADTPPYLTAEPEVTTTTVQAGDFLIMASDGLWDHISSEAAVACVGEWIGAVRAGRVEGQVPGGPRGVYRPVNGGREEGNSDFELEGGAYATWEAKPEDFVVEDGNAATHLVRNALGGRRRRLFRGVVGTYPPMSRNVRDDVTCFVVFFGDVKGA